MSSKGRPTSNRKKRGRSPALPSRVMSSPSPSPSPAKARKIKEDGQGNERWLRSHVKTEPGLAVKMAPGKAQSRNVRRPLIAKTNPVLRYLELSQDVLDNVPDFKPQGSGKLLQNLIEAILLNEKYDPDDHKDLGFTMDDLLDGTKCVWNGFTAIKEEADDISNSKKPEDTFRKGPNEEGVKMQPLKFPEIKTENDVKMGEMEDLSLLDSDDDDVEILSIPSKEVELLLLSEDEEEHPDSATSGFASGDVEWSDDEEMVEANNAGNDNETTLPVVGVDEIAELQNEESHMAVDTSLENVDENRNFDDNHEEKFLSASLSGQVVCFPRCKLIPMVNLGVRVECPVASKRVQKRTQTEDLQAQFPGIMVKRVFEETTRSRTTSLIPVRPPIAFNLHWTKKNEQNSHLYELPGKQIVTLSSARYFKDLVPTNK